MSFLALPLKCKRGLIVLLLNFIPVFLFAQVPQWAVSLSSTGSDEGYYCKTAPNGNVVVGGKFSNTLDLDPSAATYNITSNGSEDMFLACYTSTGSFLWGFNVGGTDIDAIFNIAFDAASNVFINGYFRGQNVDFDPSAAVNALSDVGLSGGNPPYGGDGFLAKYSSTGAYLWAFDLGGSTVYDFTQGLTTDEAGNVYTEIWFTGTMDIDPSPAVNTVSSITGGKICLAKYSPAGQLIWGEAFATQGGAGIDAGTRELVYKAGYLYMDGFFQNTADFDPSAATANLTASGLYDGYVAKYDSAGHYVFAKHITGSGALDEARGLSLDSAGNIYIIGYTNSASVSFLPTITNVSAPGGGGNNDIFLARYDNAGNPQWAKIIGSTSADIGHGLVVVGNKIYCTGGFTGTVDFDPAAAVSNLTANGTGSDIFVATYDLNGNYVCGFNVGGANVFDEGYRINSDPQGHILVTGQFNGASVDFDPTATTLNLTGNASGDAFLVKYDFSSATSANTLTGGTFCTGAQATLTFTSSSGPGPYTVVYTDGTNTYTQNNVTSGVPFNLSPNPTATTSYTLVSPLSVAGLCGSATSPPPANVTIVTPPVANAGKDSSICAGSGFHLNGSGGGSYLWSPAAAVDNPNIANPLVTATSPTTFTLVVSNGGCTDTDQVTIDVLAAPVADAGNDTTLCANGSVLLHGSGGTSYYWHATNFISHSQDTVAQVTDTITFYLTVTNAGGCTATDSVTVRTLPPPKFGVAYSQVQKCIQDSSVLVASGGDTYLWSPVNAISNPTNDSVTVWPVTNTTYYVTITDTVCGHTETLPVDVTIRTLPNLQVSSQTIENCNDQYIQLTATGAVKYAWFPPAGVSSPNTTSTIVIADTLTRFTIYGTDEFGCVGVTDIMAKAPEKIQNYIYVPNAFTPNDDGKNDCYKIVITGPIRSYEFHIYDRFGNEVFTTTNTIDCWDGTYKDDTMDLGTYYYFYKVELPGCPPKFGKGDFELIR